MIYGKNVDKKWTFLDHLPTSNVNVAYERPLTESSRKVSQKKQWDSVHEVMRFPLKEEEFAKIAEIDLQYPGNWFRLFSLNFIFFMETMLFSYFLFGR